MENYLVAVFPPSGSQCLLRSAFYLKREKMPAEQKLKRALSAIDDAKTALQRAKREMQGDDDRSIRTALIELDDAETYIRKAIRDIPDE
jgi:hypothetical protein